MTLTQSIYKARVENIGLVHEQSQNLKEEEHIAYNHGFLHDLGLASDAGRADEEGRRRFSGERGVVSGINNHGAQPARFQIGGKNFNSDQLLEILGSKDAEDLNSKSSTMMSLFAPSSDGSESSDCDSGISPMSSMSSKPQQKGPVFNFVNALWVVITL
uniref:Uncharacterized protein n=2 Tax=Ficus carica TaxID=3494 RepID=A0AA88EDT7_FICCA|nr:hypothetical protein TIFTF001_052884 [Ficus carica]